jgi:hypothetical protein
MKRVMMGSRIVIEVCLKRFLCDSAGSTHQYGDVRLEHLHKVLKSLLLGLRGAESEKLLGALETSAWTRIHPTVPHLERIFRLDVDGRHRGSVLSTGPHEGDFSTFTRGVLSNCLQAA